MMEESRAMGSEDANVNKLPNKLSVPGVAESKEY